VDISLIQSMIDSGYISKRKHPTENLYILNYTSKTQIENNWNEATLNCRGLIVDDDWNIIERPFKKFFTLSQLDNPILKPFRDMVYGELNKTYLLKTFDKIDGSLIILLNYHGKLQFTTRGSFDSEQAKEANRLLAGPLNKRFQYSWSPGVTYLFEIVYPENRIVIDYGDERDLYLLAAIDKQTGKDRWDLVEAYQHFCANYEYKCPTSQQYNIDNLDDLLKYTNDNKEGFVIVFNNGERVKIKLDNYVRLHKIITGLNERHIWELLRNDQDITSYLTNVPDEFYNWVTLTVLDLTDKYNEIYNHVQSVLKKDIIDRDPPLDRKTLALKYQDYKYKTVMFAILDNKQYKQTIWRLIRPSVRSN